MKPGPLRRVLFRVAATSVEGRGSPEHPAKRRRTPDHAFRSSPKVTSCPLCSVPLSSVYFAQVVLGPTVHITMDDKHNPDITSSKEVSLPQWTAEPNKTSKKWRPLLAMAALSALALYTLNPSPLAEPARGIRCPYQPEPLHPKIAWDMTKDEKARSADIFSQAVVCHPSGWKGVS
jgi:hypothetical protein